MKALIFNEANLSAPMRLGVRVRTGGVLRGACRYVDLWHFSNLDRLELRVKLADEFEAVDVLVTISLQELTGEVLELPCSYSHALVASLNPFATHIMLPAFNSILRLARSTLAFVMIFVEFFSGDSEAIVRSKQEHYNDIWAER